MAEIRLATRSSALALAQTRWVAERLRESQPDATVRLIEVTTTGDADDRSPITELTEVGAFVRAIQEAVLRGDADAAVHSSKDLPVGGPDGLGAVFPEREMPWDVLCGSTLEALPRGARVGTGSPRRSAQLLTIRPDLDVVPIRGNVDTRLRKVADGEYAAVVLAEAGLRRLGRTAEIGHRFDIGQMVPCPGQGALAVEVRRGSPAEEMALAIDDGPTRRAVELERAMLAATGAGCRSALGVLAEFVGEDIAVSGFVADDRGSRRARVAARDADEALAALRQELSL